jgi:type I restriction enzyme M protein
MGGRPYAGVSTAVYFLPKNRTGGTDKVWFYDMQTDGYTLDDKRSETKDNDIADIMSLPQFGCGTDMHR